MRFVQPPLRSVLLFAAVVLAHSSQSAFAQPGGGPNAPDLKVVSRFDRDNDGRLNAAERGEAREWLATQNTGRRGGPGRGFGGPPGGGPPGGGPGGGPPGGGPPRGFRGRGNRPAGTVGPAVSPSDVKVHPDAGLYDTGVLRTVFLQFENEDWEEELAAFKPTDVEVPATMIVDGRTYEGVGVSFRGASSFFMIPTGSKRSFNLSLDFINEDQRLGGYKTLNLLNCNGDASMMSSLFYHDIASQKIATPKVNFVKVVVNGRSWGVYANAQQFNKDFLRENYGSGKGARWKVSGSPRGDGGLRYLGEELEEYKRRFDIKSKDNEQAWKDLVNLCRVLNETPVDELEEALEPILDVDGALWFLAVDVALINSDGYWTRASDYNIYQNADGVFHILPHDMNEAFRGARGGRGGGPGGPPGFGPPGRGFGQRPPGAEGGPGGRTPGGRPPAGEQQRPRPGQQPRGEQRPGRPGSEPGGRRGFGGGRGGAGFELDPLVGLDDERFPLRSRLLANKQLRKRYLQYIRTIADQYLDWDYLGPKVASARALIADEVRADTRKLMTVEDFLSATDAESGRLREFCDKRAAYLLQHPEVRKVAAD